MGARTEPPERDCEVVVEDLVAGPRMFFLFSLKAATTLRRRRPQRHRSRHMDAEKLRMERRSDLHSTRKRSLEGRRESLYYAPSAREGSTKTQGLMSYQKRGRATKPCFSNCPIRGTGPSARPRKNAANGRVPAFFRGLADGPPSAVQSSHIKIRRAMWAYVVHILTRSLSYSHSSHGVTHT